MGTLICVAIVRIFTPLRVTDREERIGLDISQHGENAYQVLMVWISNKSRGDDIL